MHACVFVCVCVCPHVCVCVCLKEWKMKTDGGMERKDRARDHEFEVSLGSIVRPHIKQNKKIKTIIATLKKPMFGFQTA